MRILFVLITVAALAVGGYAVYKEEYVIALAMLFVVSLQVVNFLNYNKRKRR